MVYVKKYDDLDLFNLAIKGDINEDGAYEVQPSLLMYQDPNNDNNRKYKLVGLRPVCSRTRLEMNDQIKL